MREKILAGGAIPLGECVELDDNWLEGSIYQAGGQWQRKSISCWRQRENRFYPLCFKRKSFCSLSALWKVLRRPWRILFQTNKSSAQSCISGIWKRRDNKNCQHVAPLRLADRNKKIKKTQNIGLLTFMSRVIKISGNWTKEEAPCRWTVIRWC